MSPSANLAHSWRWYNHIRILSCGNDTSGFTGAKKPLSAYGPPATVAKPSNDDDDDDDDDDLFGSDTEEQKVFGRVHMVLENTGKSLHEIDIKYNSRLRKVGHDSRVEL